MKGKAAIRNLMRARRAALAPEIIRQASARIQRAVIRLPEWTAARRVCLYLAMPVEVRTRALLAACRREGKQILVPAWRVKKRCYDLARFRPGESVKKGRWGVPEPVRPRWALSAGADFAAIPGLAFDRAGGRLGHGGGYYDRLLTGAALQRAYKVGLAMEFQVVGRVPMSARDVRVNAVVTEKTVSRRDGAEGRPGRALRPARGRPVRQLTAARRMSARAANQAQ